MLGHMPPQGPEPRPVEFTDVGHMVAGDRNDAFNEAVLDFLREAGF